MAVYKRFNPNRKRNSRFAVQGGLRVAAALGASWDQAVAQAEAELQAEGNRFALIHEVEERARQIQVRANPVGLAEGEPTDPMSDAEWAIVCPPAEED